MKALALLWTLLACLPAIVYGHAGHEHKPSPAPVSLAPGYGKLAFPPPSPARMSCR